MYGSKKKYIEEIFILEKSLINMLKVIFKENTSGDLAFQTTTWLNQDID